MARYRSKDETDIRWNSIRRRLTGELDMQIQEFREVRLNEILTAAWNKYAESLSTGDVLRIEEKYDTWVSQALDDFVSIRAIDPPAGDGK